MLSVSYLRDANHWLVEFALTIVYSQGLLWNLIDYHCVAAAVAADCVPDDSVSVMACLVDHDMLSVYLHEFWFVIACGQNN